MIDNENIFEGAGGGGGKAPPPAITTKRSDTCFRILVTACAGPVVGLVNGLKDVYLDGTAMQNADGGFNFPNVTMAQRTGTPTQTSIEGFSQVESSVNVSSDLKFGTPVVRSTTDGLVDAVNITLLIEKLFTEGGSYGSTVSYRIRTKPTSSGLWQVAHENTFGPDTILSGYEFDVYIPRPAGTTGPWDFEVTKTVADSENSKIGSSMKVSRFTEIIDAKITYPGVQLVGLNFFASSVGNQMPIPQLDGVWAIVRVPANYDPIARSYSGEWDHTFKWAWSNNPAWCLLDWLTDVENGLGADYTDSMINMESLYNAAVYNDQFVSYTDAQGNLRYEPRFALGLGVLAAAQSATAWIDSICHVMRANLTWTGLLTLYQDRPADAKHLVQRQNIIAGSWSESENSVRARHTEVNITYVDETDGWKSRVDTIEAPQELIDKYNYSADDVELWGVSSPGQVQRHGRFLLYTEGKTTTIATWQMNREAMNFQLNEIVKVMDQGYSGADLAGRIVSINGTTVKLDRPVELTTATSDIDISTADGLFETRRVTQGVGTFSTLTLSSPLTKTPNEQATFQVMRVNGLQARQFRITKIKEKDIDSYDIEAVIYDPNKYAYIDDGIQLPAGVFMENDLSGIGDVNDLFVKETIEYLDNIPRRGLVVEWKPPTQGVVTGYSLRWRINDQDWIFEQPQITPSFLIRNVAAGTFNITVFAYGLTEAGTTQRSTGRSIPYTIDISNATGSLLNTPLNLQVVGGGTEFQGEDLKIEWQRSTADEFAPVPLKDFEVILRDTVSQSIVRQEYVPAVGVGAKQFYAYTMGLNRADTGGIPRRSLTVSVRSRDTSNKTSNAASATFTNPPPAAVNNVVVSSGTGNIKLTHDRNTEKDLAGYMWWRGTTNNFAANASNLIYSGETNYVTDTNTTIGTQVWYRVAAYDTFGMPQNGAGLNISGTFAGTALKYPGVPDANTLPTTGMVDKEYVYLSTDKALYQYDAAAGVWRRNAFASGATTPTAANGKNGDQFLNTTDGKLYIHNGTAWIAQVGDIRANSILAAMIKAGEIQAGHLAVDAVTAGTVAANVVTAREVKVGTLTGDKFVVNTITADLIRNQSLTSTQIAAFSISADRINVVNLAAIKADLGAITAGQVTITGAGNGDWGYIRSTNKWLDGTWGWIFSQSPNGSSFFDITMNNFRFYGYHNAGVSVEWGLSAPGISMGPGGLTVSQANVIGHLQIAGGAACTMSWGQGNGGVYAGVNVPSGTTAIVHCVASHRGTAMADGVVGGPYVPASGEVALSGIGNSPVYPLAGGRYYASGDSDGMIAQYAWPNTTICSLIALGSGSHNLYAGNSWGAPVTLCCTVAVRP